MLQEKISHRANNGLLPTPPMPEGLGTIELSENSRRVLMRRYVRRGKDGEPIETIDEMFWRVAYHVASCEEKWDEDYLESACNYYQLLISKSPGKFSLVVY